MSGLQRPNLGTRQPPHPRRGFHHQKLPTRLKKVTGFAHRAHPQPQVSALTAPKSATCSIWLWSQSGQNVSEAHTVTFLKLLLSMHESAWLADLKPLVWGAHWAQAPPKSSSVGVNAAGQENLGTPNSPPGPGYLGSLFSWG